MSKIILRNTEINSRCILNDSTFWTPEKIQTSLWLDAQDSSTVILNGNNVSQWRDKSGNIRHATQNTASFQPSYEQNGINQKPSIKYNSLTNNKLQLDTTISITQNMSVFSVFRRETSGIWTIDIGCNILNARPHGFMWVTTNFLYNGLGQSSLNPVIFGNSTLTGNYIAQTRRNETTSQIWLNGSKYGIDRAALSVGGELYWVGHRLNQSHSGLMGEVIVINQEVTLEIQRKMEGYLAHKWNLTSQLPIDHPYKTQKPRK